MQLGHGSAYGSVMELISISTMKESFFNDLRIFLILFVLGMPSIDKDTMFCPTFS